MLKQDDKRRRYGRAFRWSLVIIALVLVVPLVPYGLAATGVQLTNPGADLWREVRGRTQAPMSTQVQSIDGAVLINPRGEDWRSFRTSLLVPVGGTVLLGVIAFIALFYLFRGRILIEGGRSGKLVPRFSVNQRVVHWFAASQLVILGLTGIVLLYGRNILIPLLGPEGFSATAAACKEIHNLFGPIFPFAVIALIVLFGRGNWFKWLDIKWFMKAGGLFGSHIADSGYYNGGQKTWFWMTVLFGFSISLSGLVLDFPVFGQGREIMGWAHVIHTTIAILFIAAALGHIYIGTLGMEGAARSMIDGYVDANWAKEHHNLWYQEMECAGMVDVEPNALEEVKRHDNIDFKGFVSPGSRTEDG